MELALGALVGLAPKLAELLKNEYVKQKGLEADIKSLSKELVMMHAALVDVSRVPPQMRNVVDNVWASSVRELSYDMEDAIDAFSMHAAGREPVAVDHSIFKKIGQTAVDIMKSFKSRHQISDKVNEIKNLSQELADLWKKYMVNRTTVNPSAYTSLDPRVRNMYKSEAELVGIEAARDELVRKLAVGGSDRSLKKVSIVGFGGLGKTTLAKTVHDRRKSDFDCSAFVSVGRKPNMPKVLGGLLEKLEESWFKKKMKDMKLDKKKYSLKNMEGWEDHQRFSDELHTFLHDKSFFIVIDDIWDSDSWKHILNCLELKDSNCGSRIIMTTRNAEVVTKGEYVYKIKPLSLHNSSELFNKRLFSGEGECLVNPSDELRDNILRKCGGVPLAIIAIASLLADKPEQKWSEVYDSMVSGDGGDSTMEIISYSYEDLPSHLKPCLLYMSIFVEEYDVDKNGLIWMWIAEGFVKILKEGDNIFEQGERYFNELINRSMMQPLEGFDCSVYGCRVHDVVYDHICNLSRKENFATLSVKEQDKSCQSSVRSSRSEVGYTTKVRRLSLQQCRFEHIPRDTLGKPEAVRSLTVEYSEMDTVLPFRRLQACRLICIEHSYIPSFKDLGKLMLLRYLAICYMHVENLPEEIANLKSLQSMELLDIGPHELPSAVCALTTLMFIHINGFERLPAKGMGNLVSLEELRLDPVVGKSETDDLVVQLGKMTRLRVLGIRFTEEMEESSQDALVKSLYSLGNIQDLKLSFPKPMKACAAWDDWKPPRKLWRLSIPDIMFSRLPAWISPMHLPCLSNLAVFAYVVQEQDMRNLARLPKLCYLHLPGPGIQHQGYTVGDSATGGGFKKLRVCDVNTAFKFLPGAMPDLEVLLFKVIVAGQRCTFDGVEHEILATTDVIGDLDFGLGDLLSLEQVYVQVDCDDASASDVEEAKAVVIRAAEDHPKHPGHYVYRTRKGVVLSESDEEGADHFVEIIDDHFTLSDEEDEDHFVERISEHLMLSDEEDVKQDEDFHVSAREMKDGTSDFDFSLLWNRSYQRLEKVTFHVDCEGARLSEVVELEAAFREAVDVHPKRPTFQLVRENVDKMVSTSDHCCNSEQGEGCHVEPVTPSLTMAQEQEIKSDDTMHKPADQ